MGREGACLALVCFGNFNRSGVVCMCSDRKGGFLKISIDLRLELGMLKRFG